MNDPVFDGQLKFIRSKINNIKNIKEKKLVSLLLNDLLVSAIYVPSKLEKNGKKRLSIETVSINGLKKVLLLMEKNLLEGKSVLDISFFDHLKLSPNQLGLGDTYLKASVAQRSLLLSVGNLNGHIKTSYLKSDTFQKILNRKDLPSWMLGASGATRQDFVNTCTGAAITQDMLSTISDLGAMKEIGMQYHAMMTQALAEASPVVKSSKTRFLGPTVEKKAQMRLDKSEKELEKLGKQIEKILSSEKSIDPKIIEQQKKDWNKTMQYLFTLTPLKKNFGIGFKEDSVDDLNDISIFSEKENEMNALLVQSNGDYYLRYLRDSSVGALKDQYKFKKIKLEEGELLKERIKNANSDKDLKTIDEELSMIVIKNGGRLQQKINVTYGMSIREHWHLSALLSSIGHFLTPLSRPSFARILYEGALDNEVILDTVDDNITNKDLKVNRNYIWKEEDSSKIDLQYIQDIWESIAKQGGSIVGLGQSHSGYIKAIMVGDERKFAVSNPFKSEYTILSEQEMLQESKKKGSLGGHTWSYYMKKLN